MSIVKTLTGEASFVVEEHYQDEKKAEEGKTPISREIKNVEIKIENTKWKKIDE
tara:strand:- start:966 stop:1127 length:162 start_codon:yes stop_codon:yes gene_type:complete